GDTVFVPFGRAVEKYLNKFDHLKKTCLKKQSRKNVSRAVKEGLITVHRVKEAIDYIGWMTKDGHSNSTN
ncbi:17201_t:CDS:1, partial [Gigaspora rosea]